MIAYRNFPFALAVVPCSSPWTASADAVRILAPRIRTASSCSKGFTMNHYPIAVATALLASVSTIANAAPAMTLYPQQIGAETARYQHGSATISLKSPTATVEIRPLPVEDGRAAFSIAIFNHDGRPANLGMENITAVVNGIPTPVPTYAQLAEAAERKARQAKIGTALFAGVLAGVASTASNQGSYYRHVRGPRGGFTQAIHWQDDTPGVIGATAAVAGGAMVIGGIDRKLDYTLDQLGTQILQTTTIDPGSSFGGMVILPIDRDAGHPADIRVNVAFDGRVYAFGFRLTRSGIGVPAPVPAAARADAPGVQALPVDLAGEGGGE
ncbi:hypothetical protein MBESOW_P4343 [Sphingobium xenophagum]|uniref:Uncharacterized protein n=4 Tax=Sphingobium TaxID=165695 RepID=A0A401J6E6_SPHXE|nr:hypothetical protein MBESOW_P4343 [Sphingobium xenophagum]